MRTDTSTLNGTALLVFLLASLVPSPALAMQPFIDPDSLPPRALERSTPLMSSGCGSELRIADPIVDIQELPDPVYVHTLAKSEISAIEKESSGRMREAAGLTLVLAGTVQTYTSPAQTLTGTDCVVFHGVRIVPMKQVTVYVAREYPVGSCNYREVQRHEAKHVAIARRLVSEYRSRIERVVGDLRLQSRGFPAREDENASTGKVTSEVVSAVQGVIDELQVAMVNANRVLDKADTERTLQACPFW